MKLLVVVPSTEALKGAGVRIRYNRLLQPLAREGVELLLRSVEQCPQILHQCDAVLISKVMDARAAGVAHACRSHGVLVGADLFDNYFSQKERSACRPQRRWLRQLCHYLDFGLCSTEAMEEVMRQEAPELPLHLLPDAHGGRIEMLHQLQRSMQERQARRRSTQSIHVVWFGIGDNPIFEVGLTDLDQHSDQLRNLESTGRTLDLRVLTNERALNEQGLQRLNRLPVRTTVEIWSEELETRRLLESDVAFLPVANTEFSKVKSPNRGITALEHGCQVLTTGTHVYNVIAPFIYTDCRQLLEDLEAERPKVRETTLPELRRHLNNVASPASEARRLEKFLKAISKRTEWSKAGDLAILHGIQPFPIQPDWCRRSGAISVQSPLAGPDKGEDLAFQLDGDGEVVLVISDRLLELSMPQGIGAALRKVKSRQSADDRHRHRLTDLAQQGDLVTQPEHTLAIQSGLRCRTTGERLTLRSAVLGATQALIQQLVPGINIVLNEELPTWP